MSLDFVRSGNVMEVTFDGSTNWVSKTESNADGAFPDGCYIDKLVWKTATEATNFVIRNVSVTGARIIPLAVDQGGQGLALTLNGKTKYFPAVKGTECSNGDILSVHFRLSQREYEI